MNAAAEIHVDVTVAADDTATADDEDDSDHTDDDTKPTHHNKPASQVQAQYSQLKSHPPTPTQDRDATHFDCHNLSRTLSHASKT